LDECWKQCGRNLDGEVEIAQGREQMKTMQSKIFSAVALSALALCGVVHAQDAPPPPPPGGMHGHHGPAPDGMMGFLGVEAGLGGKTITGDPFTASFTQSSTETLQDGNQIQHSSSGSLARDSSGRTRRDVVLPGAGPLAASGGTPPHLVFIHDPVAQMDYVLDLDRKTAHEMPLPPGPPKNWNGGNPPQHRNQNNVATSTLGAQTLSGLTLEGTRTTRTIPAGAIGNSNPIVSTVDRWYSSDLQLDAIVNRTDPRMGTTNFSLSNIQRSEPDPSLFQVPAGFTVTQGGPGHHGNHGTPPPPPPSN
jgi:hypothetical protein